MASGEFIVHVTRRLRRAQNRPVLVTIARYELEQVMIRRYVEAPFYIARNLALYSIFADKGVRVKPALGFGLDPPELEPPFKVWWNDAKACWEIEQH